ncbi:MAG: ATP synthase subunit C [Clostridium sp.]|nr:ATP synthase subunit C [Clostridium sp.]MCM1547635.1 ATP synthase subunit C [Ruminococcus sp.]
MNIMEIMLLPLFAVVLLILPVVYVLKKKNGNSAAKKAFIVNICSFFGVLALAAVLPVGSLVSAETAEAAANAANAIGDAGLGYLAAALAVGLGSIGCGIAVGSAAPAAIGAVAEEPKSFSKALIFVALGEGVALYGFLISFMILNKL